jgi:hypothetical protein
MREQTPQSTGRVYSQRLGALTPQQFQAALTRFGLGTFVEATPVSQGLFGQNVFVQSSQGAYVLRGAPHYPWQFPKERFGPRSSTSVQGFLSRIPTFSTPRVTFSAGPIS